MIYTGIYEAKLKLPFEGETFGNKGTVLIFPGGGYERKSAGCGSVQERRL